MGYCARRIKADTAAFKILIEEKQTKFWAPILVSIRTT